MSLGTWLVKALDLAPVRFLGRFGLGFGAATGMAILVTTALATVVSYTNALAYDSLQFLLLCGFGQALNIIGAALIARSALQGKFAHLVSKR